MKLSIFGVKFCENVHLILVSYFLKSFVFVTENNFANETNIFHISFFHLK